jgi:hypothetical protein
MQTVLLDLALRRCYTALSLWLCPSLGWAIPLNFGLLLFDLLNVLSTPGFMTDSIFNLVLYHLPPSSFAFIFFFSPPVGCILVPS